MTGVRRIGKIKLPNLTPNTVSGSAPSCVLVDPCDLYVEETYQRNIADKSIRLIRSLVANWDWAHMKPPICVRDGDKLFVLDGQHTAIAAASHPGISKIPVMIVRGDKVSERAKAFVAHNKMRIAITSMQIYHSEVAAGNEVALAVEKACARAGVKVLKYPPAHGIFRTGETVAILSLKKIATNKGVNGLARILKVLKDAGRAPIRDTEISATYSVVYGGQAQVISDYDLTSVIRLRSIKEWEQRVRHRREKEKITLTAALADEWIKAARKGRVDES